MKKKENRIFVHESILTKVKEICELSSENESSSFNEISKQLIKFSEVELIKYNLPLYRRFDSNNNSYKGISSTSISHAFNCEGKYENGATRDLRDIMCYFAFKKDWSETLKALNISEEEEIFRTLKKKKK